MKFSSHPRVPRAHQAGLSRRSLAGVGLSESEGLRTGQTGSSAHRCTLECTDRHIRQLTNRNPFSKARDIQSRLLQEQVDLCPPKPYATECMKHSYVHGYQQQGVSLITQHRARHLAW
ncbi:hypothetical protein TNCV_1453221 [Trichonephila clavipes]|nr:hypothetical protein TNCV_1453221 [Trichonephila clavipes]